MLTEWVLVYFQVVSEGMGDGVEVDGKGASSGVPVGGSGKSVGVGVKASICEEQEVITQVNTAAPDSLRKSRRERDREGSLNGDVSWGVDMINRFDRV